MKETELKQVCLNKDSCMCDKCLAVTKQGDELLKRFSEISKIVLKAYSKGK